MKFLDWRVGCAALDVAPDVAAVNMIVTRGEAEGLRVGSALDGLLQLVEDERLRRQLVHGLVLSFEGWDGDSLDPSDVPAFRSYLRALHEHWPFWLHFLAPLPEQWSMLLLGLLPSDSSDRAGTPGPLRRVEFGEFWALMESLLAPMNLLHDQMRLGEAARHAVFDGSFAAVQGVFA